MKITYLDPIWASVSKQDIKTLIPCLSFRAQFARPRANGFGKEIKEYDKPVITKNGLFPAGLVPRVVNWCEQRMLPVEVVGAPEPIMQAPAPQVIGLNLRDDQFEMIDSALINTRGILKAPTGSGKTVIAAGMISTFPGKTVLFLCHTLSLLRQTRKEFEKFLGEPCGIIGEGEFQLERITVATMQSFWKRLEKDETLNSWDIVIIDEAHHCSTLNCTYVKILCALDCKFRYGLTATPRTDGEGVLTMEGFIGPVIGELTMKKGLQENILAKPRVKIIKVPFNQTVRELRKYDDVYAEGVVRNRSRNRTIISKAKEFVLEGKSVLIFVVRLEHANELISMADAIGLDAQLVHGATEGEDREQIRQAMIDKEQKCVIATAAWREGVNIPALNVVINAAGGKSEIATLQALGRGLRTFPGKSEILLIDFFDPSHMYLISHFGQRISLYCEEEWL